MNAEKTFNRWMALLVGLFIALFSYIIIADRYAPITTEGRVQSFVVQIAPEVTGHVEKVHVTNNQMVKKGDVLITIERRKFELAYEEALLAMRAASDTENSLKVKKEAAKAKINKAEITLTNHHQELKRVAALFERKLISKAVLDNVETAYRVASAELNTQKQNLKIIDAQLGMSNGKSTQVLRANNRVNQAQLDLTNLVIVAPSDGVVTNLQVQRGTMAKINAPLLTFVSTDQMWVSADFREKSLVNLHHDSIALVTFDALPGRVYQFNYLSQDFGVAAVQQKPDGSLTSVEVNNRWVRDAQRSRVHFSNAGKMPKGLFVGSRATVTFFNQETPFWATMANWQIKLFGLFHFIY